MLACPIESGGLSRHNLLSWKNVLCAKSYVGSAAVISPLVFRPRVYTWSLSMGLCFLLNILEQWFVAWYGTWEGLAACKILLKGVAVICPQFWELAKTTPYASPHAPYTTMPPPPQPLLLLAFPQGFFFEKMTFLEIFDMYVFVFDIFNQYWVITLLIQPGNYCGNGTR
jgi:hypothetical protein